MTRFTDVFGKFDSSPICAADKHECDSVAYCVACEGQVYCDEHLKQCDGCRKLWCEKHAKLTKTDCGWLCKDCVPESTPAKPMPNSIPWNHVSLAHPPRVRIGVAVIGNGLYCRVGKRAAGGMQ